MQRTINWALMLAALASMFALYAIKDGTRRLEARVQAQERALERAENDVSVLTAERAHLARPERLEPLARKLGMAPVSARQYLRLEAGPDRKTPVDQIGAARHSDSRSDGSSAAGIAPSNRIESAPVPNPSPLALWLSQCSSCLDPPRGQGAGETPLRAGQPSLPSAR
jgi:cell division protein FtsL